MPCQPGRRRCHFRGSGSPGRLSGLGSARRRGGQHLLASPRKPIATPAPTFAASSAAIRRLASLSPAAMRSVRRMKSPLFLECLPSSATAIRARLHPSLSGRSTGESGASIGTESCACGDPKFPVLLWQPPPHILCQYRHSPAAPNFGPERLPGAPAFVLAGDIFAHSDFELPSLPSSAIDRLAGTATAHRTRPTLKIQDGCGNRCTFCIIPSTRGNSRSLAKPQVLDSVEQFIAAGGQELVISGINLGRWGRDLAPQLRFEDLLAEIFETTSLPRLRISSVEPMDWTDGLIDLLRHYGQGQHPRLARHVHMPLQSGSDRVLRRMHRRYRPWHYAERLAKVRAACPDAAIGADVMVGFPGETAEEFRRATTSSPPSRSPICTSFPFPRDPERRAGTFTGATLYRLRRGPRTHGRTERSDPAEKSRLSLWIHRETAQRRDAGVAQRETCERSTLTNTPAMTENFISVEIAGHAAAEPAGFRPDHRPHASTAYPPPSPAKTLPLHKNLATEYPRPSSAEVTTKMQSAMQSTACSD